MTKPLDINPLTRIGELLDAYPDLEDVLVETAPAFSKLRNPILRRTVAKVATVQAAASIAGIDARELVARLRSAAGQRVEDTAGLDFGCLESAAQRWTAPPAWIEASNVGVAIDADALLAAGEVPLARITQAARRLRGDKVILMTSTFRPVPLMEALEKQGFAGFFRETGPDRFETIIYRLSSGPTAGHGN